MAQQQHLPPPGFPEPLVLNAQGWWKSTVLMPCQMSLFCWVLSILWPTTHSLLSQPLPQPTFQPAPLTDLTDLTDLHSFEENDDDKSNATIWGRQETLLVLKVFHGDLFTHHEVTEISQTVTCSKKLFSRGLPSPPALASASYLHTTYALHPGFKCVCYLNLCNISQTFLY